jgi:hypothetical protein
MHTEILEGTVIIQKKIERWAGVTNNTRATSVAAWHDFSIYLLIHQSYRHILARVKICVCVCTLVYVCICVSVRLYMCASCVCMCIYVYIRIYVCMYEHAHGSYEAPLSPFAPLGMAFILPDNKIDTINLFFITLCLPRVHKNENSCRDTDVLDEMLGGSVVNRHRARRARSGRDHSLDGQRRAH